MKTVCILMCMVTFDNGYKFSFEAMRHHDMLTCMRAKTIMMSEGKPPRPVCKIRRIHR